MAKTAAPKRKPRTRRLTNQQIVDAVQAHRWIGRYSLKHPTGFYASQNLAALERATKEIGERQELLMRQYADRDGDGDDAPPKRNKRGDSYEIITRDYEYRQANEELMADTMILRVLQLRMGDFDFLMQPPPRSRDDEEEPTRQNFLDVIPPTVWAQFGPLLQENEELEAKDGADAIDDEEEE